MKIKTMAEKAIAEQNPVLAGDVSDYLRYRVGMNYREQVKFLGRILPAFDIREWDLLLCEADFRDSYYSIGS